jgi:ribosome-binding factor A
MRYRKEKVQDLLREELSSILFRDIKDPGLGFVTILEVRMTEDLKVAKVMYSIYGSEEEKDKTLRTLKRSRGYIRFLLSQRVKLRYTPELEFIYDNRYEKMARIDELLKKDGQTGED